MVSRATDRLRHFNRIITGEIGALDHSFLGRGRPLGEARILSAIGSGMKEVGLLRERLGLDSGLLSRILRSLEREGLIETHRLAGDARRRACRLTPAGKGEYLAYEKLSNNRAHAMLARHSNPQKLLEAMDMIACTYGRDRVRLEERDPRDADAKYCLEQYYNELDRRFKTGFKVSLSRDPDAQDMIRPRGVFLVAFLESQAIGAVGLKGSGGPVAEIKRLWVAPAARNLGLGRLLMLRAEEKARELSIATLRLDTNSALGEAVKMYHASGWTEIERFNDDPYPDIFFEKQL